jgi:hypothetical protein
MSRKKQFEISFLIHHHATTMTLIIISVMLLLLFFYSIPKFAWSQPQEPAQGNATTTITSLPIADMPFYREHITITGQSPINATHVEVSLSGSGNLTLPNSTQTIAVNSTGNALVNFETTSVIAQELLTKEDGK